MEPTHDQHERSPDLIDVLPTTARRVIDIGCGAGVIAKEYQVRASPDYYLGIEIVPEDAEIARQFCSKCILGNIETFSDQEWEALENFDLWVFGDVLEHLYDPWKVLKKVRKSIAPGGQVLSCIPNSQNWWLQMRLANGDWRYDDKGLLDRTHIRFFTRKTIIEMFQEAGFEIAEIVPRYVHHPAADIFLNIIENMAAASGGDPKTAREDASVFQYIVRAR